MIILTRLSVRNFKSLRKIDLPFPPQGSVLIEGYNEAGKSTLFETIYFALYGEPLVTEESLEKGRGTNESAITYGEQQSNISLEMEIDGTTILKVQRTLYRAGKTTDARLEIIRPGLEPEIVTKQTPVNKRLIQEMNKLDKETLLNSCFVEQKKLERLEQMGTDKRQEILERLLNLDKLQILQTKYFKVTKQEEVEIQQAGKELTLAQLQYQLPQLERKLAAVQRKLAAITIHQALNSIHEQEALKLNLQRQQEQVKTEKSVLETKLTRIDAARLARDELGELIRLKETLASQENKVLELRSQVEELNRREREELPKLEHELADLERLHSSQEQLAESKKQLTELNNKIKEATEELQEIQGKVTLIAKLEEEIAQLKNQIAVLEKELTTARISSQTRLVGAESRQQVLEELVGWLKNRRDLERDLREAQQVEENIKKETEAYILLLGQLEEAKQEKEKSQETAIAAEKAFQEAEHLLNVASELVALEKWVNSKREKDGESSYNNELETAEEKVRFLQEELEKEKKLKRFVRQRLLLVVVVTGMSLFLGIMLLFLNLGLVFGAICILVALITGSLATKFAGELRSQQHELARVTGAYETAKQEEVKARMMAELSFKGVADRLADSETQLREQGATVPPDKVTGEARLTSLKEEIASVADMPLDLINLRTFTENRRGEREEAQHQKIQAETNYNLLKVQVDNYPARSTRQTTSVETIPTSVTIQSRLVLLNEQIQERVVEIEIEPDGEKVELALKEVNNEISNQKQTLATLKERETTIPTQQQSIESKEAELQDYLSWLAQHDTIKIRSALQELVNQATELEKITQAQEKLVETQATTLGFMSIPVTIQQNIGQKKAELNQFKQELGTRLELEAQEGKLIIVVNDQFTNFKVLWENLLPLPEDLKSDTQETPRLEELKNLRLALVSILQELDEIGTRQQLQELAGKDGELRQSVITADGKIEEQRNEIGRILRLYGLVAEPAFETIREVFREFSEVEISSWPELHSKEQELNEKLGATRWERDKLARDLSLNDVILNVEEAETRLATLKHEREVKRRAEVLLEGTRRRMVDTVIPNTLAYMRQLLPTLTMDRYRDCEITSDNKLRVWDELAGRYISKNIFSGGTRDQFSLALRMAFALATLPQQLGSTPGFIFLDEPLSSFDGPRTAALVELLTRGKIAENFSQIFVISHSQLFDLSAFTYHLQLREGEMVEYDYNPNKPKILKISSAELAVPMNFT